MFSLSLSLSLSLAARSRQWARASSLERLHDHTQDTPRSVELLWTSDQPDAEISTWQHTAFTRDRHL